VDRELQAKAVLEFEKRGLKKRAGESTPEWRARVNTWSRQQLRQARMNSIGKGGVYTGWADQVLQRIERGERVSATCEAMARDVILNRDGGGDAGDGDDLRGRSAGAPGADAGGDVEPGLAIGNAGAWDGSDEAGGVEPGVDADRVEATRGVEAGEPDAGGFEDDPDLGDGADPFENRFPPIDEYEGVF
jgi:hypothetical protein